MSTNAVRFVFDQICQIAARRLGARAAIVVECNAPNSGRIRGSVGCNCSSVQGSAEIAGLQANERDHLYIATLRANKWFERHPLYHIFPNAKSLHLFSVLSRLDEQQRYLAIIDPAPRTRDSIEVSLLISDLTSLAGAIFDIEHERTAAERQVSITPEVSSLQGGFSEAESHTAPLNENALVSFLMETLICKKGLHVRNGVGYMTVRAWRSHGREMQMAAMHALKRSRNDKAEKTIATELVTLATQVNGNGYEFVVPIPCGSSNEKDCLSVRLARHVADLLGLPLLNCLTPQASKGKSHPSKSAGLKPYAVVGKVSGRVLLIDDVATTGTHLEFAANALKVAGANPTPIAWIGPRTINERN